MDSAGSFASQCVPKAIASGSRSPEKRTTNASRIQTRIKLRFAAPAVRLVVLGTRYQPGVIDRRQQRFLRAFGQADDSQFQPPDNKLILATSAPSTKRKLATEDQTITNRAIFCRLIVRSAYQDNSGKPVFQNTGDEQLKPGQCRLDLSGTYITMLAIGDQNLLTVRRLERRAPRLNRAAVTPRWFQAREAPSITHRQLTPTRSANRCYTRLPRRHAVQSPISFSSFGP